MNFRILRLCVMVVALLIFGATSSLLAPVAQAQFVSFTQASQHHGGSAGIAGWQQLQDTPSVVIQGGCTTGTTTCQFQVISTTAGSAGMIFVAVGNSSSAHLSSVSGGGTWTVLPSSECNSSNATAGTVDCAYNPAITTGTTSFTTTVSASATGFYAAELFEYALPAGATSASLDEGCSTSGCGTNFTSSCTTCSGVALTTTATDVIAQFNDCGPAATGWNDFSAPYFTDIFTNAIDLNSVVGSISAPTYTQSTGYCLFAAIALKSNLGTFTPITPSPNFALVNYTQVTPGACTSCVVTIPSTGSGNLLYIIDSNPGAATITASDGTDTFTPCVAANIIITATNDSLTCVYTDSLTAAKTSVTVMQSVSTAPSIGIYEVSRNTGTFAIDGQNASQRTVTGQIFNGQTLTGLTGSNDVCFQGTYNPGGAIGPSLYMQPRPGGNLGGVTGGEGSAAIRLNDASGTAPVWITNQNVASAVNGVCFK
jgi:hypothetical protein